MEATKEIFKASLLVEKSIMPRPPSLTGTDKVCLLTVSILELHKKENTRVLKRDITHSGVGSTLERNQNLPAPRILMIKALPTKDSDLVFQRFKFFSNSFNLPCQLAIVTLARPLHWTKNWI